MSELLAVGSKAPAFSAAASDGKTYRLSDLLKQGPVALILYPGNNTPGCNRQLATVRDALAEFTTRRIQPFGVNPAAPASHARYAEKMKFNFPLLSDPEEAIARAYHALKDDDQHIQRSVYVIARDGTIAFAQRGAPPVSEIVAAVDAEPRGP
jgi:thioredoxin-dependent peroxiredoxin